MMMMMMMITTDKIGEKESLFDTLILYSLRQSP